MNYDICKECGDCRHASYDYCFKDKGIVFATDGKGNDAMVQRLLRISAGKPVFLRKMLFSRYRFMGEYAKNCRFCAEQMVCDMNRGRCAKWLSAVMKCADAFIFEENCLVLTMKIMLVVTLLLGVVLFIVS